MINHNNRPSLAILLPVITATITIPVLVAHKKMKILGAKIAQEGAIALDAVNYVSYQLKVNNVAVGAAVSSAGGVAARASMTLDIGTELVLEAGDYVSLVATEGGAFVEGTLPVLALDTEIVGN